MPSTYTFTTKSASSEASGSKVLSHFQNQPIDGSRISIQGIANGIQTQDATNTPVTSSKSLTSSVTTLNTPESAITITIANTGTTNALAFSEVSNLASFGVLNAGQSVTLPCANMAALYVNSTSGTTLSFWYAIV